MSDTPDVQLQLKKRARRRLVGAVAVAGLAAVVLPMVMDEEPKQQIQDVQIRIPSQNQAPFKPMDGKPEPAAPRGDAAATLPPVEAPAAKPAETHPEKAAERPVDVPAEAKSEHKVEKPAPKPAEKTNEKAIEKANDKPARAEENKAGGNGQYLILIGAFANPANVRQLQTKIGELGIKVITEPLDSPDGKKTRVRAGPFASREAADKALEKIKRIGVGGVVAAKQ